jgi:hypothetical protein
VLCYWAVAQGRKAMKPTSLLSFFFPLAHF